jgi:hypothetical protein
MLARVPLLRLVRSRALWVIVTGWTILVLGAAVLHKRHGVPHGTDDALDLYASFALPWLVFSVVGFALADQSLGKSGEALVVLGASPARVALATVLVTMGAGAVVGAVLGGATVLLAHGPGDPPLLVDTLQTLAFGGVAGASYAALMLVGASFVGGPWGRGLFALADWAMGSDYGFGACLTPRAHLRNLLGGEAPFDLLPWESLGLLVVLGVAFAVLAVQKAARTRV